MPPLAAQITGAGELDRIRTLLAGTCDVAAFLITGDAERPRAGEVANCCSGNPGGTGLAAGRDPAGTGLAARRLFGGNLPVVAQRGMAGGVGMEPWLLGDTSRAGADWMSLFNSTAARDGIPADGRATGDSILEIIGAA